MGLDWIKSVSTNTDLRTHDKGCRSCRSYHTDRCFVLFGVALFSRHDRGFRGAGVCVLVFGVWEQDAVFEAVTAVVTDLLSPR